MTTDFPTPELAERPEQHLAVVRETLPMDGIRDHYDRAFPLIFNSLKKAGVSPSGPAMAVTHGMPAETIDLSAAVPVTDPISADGDPREALADPFDQTARLPFPSDAVDQLILHR